MLIGASAVEPYGSNCYCCLSDTDTDANIIVHIARVITTIRYRAEGNKTIKKPGIVLLARGMSVKCERSTTTEIRIKIYQWHTNVALHQD
jgi:hypothetical protein